MQELIERLSAAAAGMEALRGSVVAGEPWPLSQAYGAEPESDWGPKEILAHVAEMLEYWPIQVDSILASPASGEPPGFGRVSTDEKRIGRVGEDRRLPAAELFDRIASESRAVGVDAGLDLAGGPGSDRRPRPARARWRSRRSSSASS